MNISSIFPYADYQDGQSLNDNPKNLVIASKQVYVSNAQ